MWQVTRIFLDPISAAPAGGMGDEPCAGCGRPPDDHTDKAPAACLGRVFEVPGCLR